MADIPLSTEALTADWVAGVLDAPVSACAATPLSAGTGVLGQIAQVSVTADGADVPSSLVVKLPPAHEEARGLATMLHLFRREHGFYAELSAAAPIAAPRCYAAPWDAATGLGVLALEDLSALRGGDLRTGYTLDEARAVLAALAQLHGAFWQSPRLDAAWLPAWNDAAIGAFVRGAYDQVWPACRQHFAAVLPEPVAAFGDGLAARLPALAEELAASPVTLLHGDCRLDNVLFRDDGGPQPVFIDWQLVASGRPALDVAYFLTQSGDPNSSPPTRPTCWTAITPPSSRRAPGRTTAPPSKTTTAAPWCRASSTRCWRSARSTPTTRPRSRWRAWPCTAPRPR